MNAMGMFRGGLAGVAGVDAAEIAGISAEMAGAIELWRAMMGKNAPWNDEARSCGVLEQIAGRLSTLVSREIGLEVENDAIRAAMNSLDKNVCAIVDYIALLGGCIARPIFSNGKLQHELLPLGDYLPTKYDFDGTLTGAVIAKRIQDGGKNWLLAERHEYEGGNHLVRCELYRNSGGVWKKAALTECKQTAEITPEYVWRGVKNPMIVEFRNGAVNKIDGTNVPVPIIAGAEDLIRMADEQFERMNWEQEAGGKIIFADRDLFAKHKKRDGQTVQTRLSPKLDRLFVQIEGDASADGKKITEYSPALRTAQQNEMLQQIFRRIELTCNIGKGTLSDMETVQQTATQYTGGRAELFAIVDKIEDEIEEKYRRCAEVFAHMAAAYRLGGGGAEIRITWNDAQTRKDIAAAKQLSLQEIAAGVKNPWEYRKEFFGEDEQTAKANAPQQAEIANPFDFGA